MLYSTPSNTSPAMMTSKISLQSHIAISMTFGSLEWDTPCLTAPCRARTTSSKCSSSFSMLCAGCGIFPPCGLHIATAFKRVRDLQPHLLQDWIHLFHVILASLLIGASFKSPVAVTLGAA